MAQVYSDNRPVREMAEAYSDIIKYSDPRGIFHGVRIYKWMGKKGLTDVKAENVILPALYQDICIDSNCGVAIVSTAINCWAILPLEGSHLAIIHPYEFSSLQAAKDWLSVN